jgi:predicted HicB family RNase H-like nuclease
MERTRRMCIRLAPEEERLLKDEAWSRRMSLSEWVRQTMLAEAKKKRKR